MAALIMSITPRAYQKLDELMMSEEDGEASDNFVEMCDEKGVCLECGHIQDDIEPNDENMHCEECGEFAVMGLTTAIVNFY